ncbi:APC family permease [Sphingomonas panacisoli]|nr:APC family permease [Sphingomonas panacisoli]
MEPGAAADDRANRRLPRILSGAMVVGLTLSALSPAASVYVTGSEILKLAGTGAALAVLIGGAVAVLASLIYAELGSAYPRAGGIYPGIDAILGRGWALAVIVLTLVTSPALLAFISLGLANYIGIYAPTWPKPIIALVLIVAAALIAATKLKTSMRVATILLMIELVAVGALVAIGVFDHARGVGDVLLTPVLPDKAGGLMATPVATMLIATLSGAYACSGAGLALYFAEDMKGPAQAIGKLVVITGVVTVMLVAGAVLAVSMGASDLPATLGSDSPIGTYLAAALGPRVAPVALTVVVLAIFNNLIAGMLAFSRFLFSSGVDQIWPHGLNVRLSALHPQSGSPVYAVLALSLVAAAMLVIGQRNLLTLLTAELFSPLSVTLAVIVGRWRRLTGVGTFRAPLFPLTPLLILAVLACYFTLNWLDHDHGRIALICFGVIAIACYAGHAIQARINTRRS